MTAKTLRKATGLSQIKLAKVFGLKSYKVATGQEVSSTWNNWERNGTPLKIETDSFNSADICKLVMEASDRGTTLAKLIGEKLS